jgi:hypothetical protein
MSSKNTTKDPNLTISYHFFDLLLDLVKQSRKRSHRALIDILVANTQQHIGQVIKFKIYLTVFQHYLFTLLLFFGFVT